MKIAILVVLGLCMGSFANALVWRIHEQERSKNKKYSVLKGHSMCPNCKHELAWYDLIPIVSWLFLKGNCRYCKKSISPQYPLVELVTALLFVVSYISWPMELVFNWQYIAFVTWLIVLVALIALAVYDLRWMLLPDKIILPVIVLVFISFILQFLIGRPINDLATICLSGLIGGGIFWLLYQISKGKWIGGGDVKLGFLIGLVIADPLLSMMYIFVAAILGTFYSVPMLINSKLKPSSMIPFGPFLIAGAIITMLFGQKIIDWYLSLLVI